VDHDRPGLALAVLALALGAAALSIVVAPRAR
jgi:hypothetical protein